MMNFEIVSDFKADGVAQVVTNCVGITLMSEIRILSDWLLHKKSKSVRRQSVYGVFLETMVCRK